MKFHSWAIHFAAQNCGIFWRALISGSELGTDDNREEHSHNKLPPLTKLNQATSPWQRESSPWIQDSPLCQPSFSPWQNDQTKSYSRTGFYQQNGPVQDVKSTQTSRTKAVVSLGGVTVASEKQRNFTAPDSLLACSNTQTFPGQSKRKLSISTPVLDCSLEVKPPSRGQLQGSRTAPGRNRDSNKTYLYCPQRQMSTDLQTDFYLSSLDIEQEDTLDAVGGIEDYKHFALRNPSCRTEIDLQKVYDRTYRPSLKLPKCNGAILTTINPKFINNNSATYQSTPVQKVCSIVTDSCYPDRCLVTQTPSIFYSIELENWCLHSGIKSSVDPAKSRDGKRCSS